ncbi:MAG: ribosome recycling factor [Bacteroidia bacterium]
MNDPRLKTIFEEMQSGMDKCIEHAAAEFAKVRAGKAMPSMLDAVHVEYYGGLVPLSQVANISTPDARTLAIQPWEKGMISAIEKGITMANMGLNPTNDGAIVRIAVPALTEERRKDLVKKLKTEAEGNRVAVRTIRKEANEKIKKAQKEGVPEDDVKSAEQKVQQTTDSYIQKIDVLVDAKEKEIMTV